MAISHDHSTSSSKSKSFERYVTLDFARGIAIVVMLFLHIVQRTLNIDALFATIEQQPIINLFALILIPFYGGLAGFFLIISAASNMVSMFRDLQRGKSVRGLVLKQVFGGFLLLIFAMLCEGLIGYQGLLGNFFRHLNEPFATNWRVMLWRWNFFETIHTIAWCLILNGCVQGLLSLKGNWQDIKRMVISYALLAVVVLALTQPIWDVVRMIVPGYPFASYPSGNPLFLPEIGTESFWQILRAPFLNPLSAPMEPIFPYLAISFLGSIIGIVLSKPREEISKTFPRKMFLLGLAMFIGGLVGILYSVMKVMDAQGFDVAASFYMTIINHRAWTPEYSLYDPTITSIPRFAWLGQFLAVNGFSLMMIMFLFRLVEFRGKSKQFADRTKFVRRFGIIAFTNYNNQWLYFIVFCLTSSLIYSTPYALLNWWGVFLTIALTYLLYHCILLGWEKVKYTGSLEWIIRTIANNLIPARKDRFPPEMKWWQKGQVDIDKSFYNANWIDLGRTTEQTTETNEQQKEDTRFALQLALVALFSGLFISISPISLLIALEARKTEGKSKANSAAIVLSAIGITIIFVGIILGLIFPIGILGIF